VTGRPAQFGRGVMVEVGGKLVEQFARNLAQLIAGDGAAADGAAADGSAAAGSAVGGSASAGNDGGTSTATATAEAGTGSAEPETVVPVATTAAPPPAQQDDDSIDLIRLVGPALLKRVVPVVIILAGLALLARLLFRRGGKAS